jgi:hypothetical protein
MPENPNGVFPGDKMDKMEMTGATEKTSAHEAVRMALKTFACLTDELEEAGLIKGVRWILIGSAISEYSQPHDIDFLLLYDDIKRTRGPLVKRRTRRKTRVSPAAAALYGQINAYDAYRTAYGKMDTRVRFPPGVTPPIPTKIDVTIAHTKVMLEALNDPVKMSRLSAASDIEMIGYEDDLPPELLSAVRTFPCLMDILQDDIPNYEYLRMERVLGEETDSSRPRSDRKKRHLVQSFLKRYAAWITKDELRQRLEDLAAHEDEEQKRMKSLADENLERAQNARRRTRRDLMGDLAFHLMERLPNDKAAEFRRAYTNYHLGYNWIQNAVETGAFLIKGEDLYDKGGGAVFKRVDRKFLKAS